MLARDGPSGLIRPGWMDILKALGFRLLGDLDSRAYREKYGVRILAASAVMSSTI